MNPGRNDPCPCGSGKKYKQCCGVAGRPPASAAHVTQLLHNALSCHQAGQLAQAEALYRQALAAQPANPDALHLLGVLCYQSGRSAAAVDLIGRALAANPAFPQACFNLAVALKSLERLEEAAAAYRNAIALKPDYAEAHDNLGNILKDLGRDAEAVASYRQALAVNPASAVTHNNLGVALKSEGLLDAAIDSYRRAIALNPAYAEAQSNLGSALLAQGRPQEAVSCLDRAALLQPDCPEVWYQLGSALMDLRRMEEAAACFRREVANQPGHLGAHNNLGNALLELGRPGEAEEAYRRTLEINPQHADMHANLSNALQALGRRDEAVAASREALRLEPHNESLQHHLNALEQVHSDRAPGGYVRKLFDGYAAKFDRHLTQELRYDIPRAIVALLKEQNVLPGVDVLDLGCGTGLVGPEIKSMARSLVGVDLSPKMLEKAEQRGIYDELVTADLLDYLRPAERSSMDVAVAADVFVYLGDLSEIFRQVRGILRPAGLFAFSVEAGEESGRDFTLATSGRYSHARAYIRRLAQEADFAEAVCISTVIRNEKGSPVHGYVFVLRRTCNRPAQDETRTQ